MNPVFAGLELTVWYIWDMRVSSVSMYFVLWSQLQR